MPLVEWIAFTFLAGITVFGVFGSLIEMISGERLSFAPPFASRRHPARLFAAPMLAGPMMLFNDALDARRGGRISRRLFMACAATCMVWTCAMGVAMFELVARLLPA